MMLTETRPNYGRFAFTSLPEREPVDTPRPDNGLDVVREVTEITARTDRTSTLAGGAVATVIIGLAIDAAIARGVLSVHGAFGPVRMLILMAIMFAVIRASVLLLLAGRPMLSSLGELRRITGAAVTPSVPWSPGGRTEPATDVEAWERLRSLAAAAQARYALVHQALVWAYVAALGFAGWVLITFASTLFS